MMGLAALQTGPSKDEPASTLLTLEKPDFTGSTFPSPRMTREASLIQ